MQVPLITADFLDRAELVYGDRVGVALATALRNSLWRNHRVAGARSHRLEGRIGRKGARNRTIRGRTAEAVDSRKSMG